MPLATKDLIGPSANRIISNRQTALDLDYDIVVHTIDGDISIDMFESMETLAEYASSYFNYRFIHFVMGLGTFSKYIKKNRDGVLVTVIKKLKGVVQFREVYRAYLVSNDSDISDIRGNYDYNKLDQSGMTRVTLQLINQEIELIRTLFLDGVYTKVTVNDLMLVSFKNIVKNVGVDGKNVEIDVNIEKPHNGVRYNHIVLPTGLKLLSLPTFLQDKEYGVYDGDIGVYLKKILVGEELKLNLFIYPLNTVPETLGNELHITHTAEPLYNEMDCTYILENDVLDILSTTDITLIDSGENEESNSGNLLSSSDPSAILTYNSNIGSSGVHHKAQTQVSASKPYDKVDNVNIDNYVGNESNLHKHRSKLSSRGTVVISVIWNHSDETLLHPGMVTTFKYQKENEVKKLKGRLLSSATVYNESTKSVSTKLVLRLRRI